MGPDRMKGNVMNTLSTLYEAAYIYAASNKELSAMADAMADMMALPRKTLYRGFKDLPRRVRFEYADPSRQIRLGNWFLADAARFYEDNLVEEGIEAARQAAVCFENAGKLGKGIPLKESRIHNEDRGRYADLLIEVRNILSIRREARRMIENGHGCVPGEQRAEIMLAALASAWN